MTMQTHSATRRGKRSAARSGKHSATRIGKRSTTRRGKRSATRRGKRNDNSADERDKDTQNQSREDVVAGRGDNLDAVREKCNMCCQLEVQAKLDVEANRVCQAGAWCLPSQKHVTDAVWVELGEKNREGLVRWYPVRGTGVGFAVVVNLDGVVEGLRAFTEDADGEHASEPFQAQVVNALAYDTRSGRVKFWPPPKELNGVVACNHFEDVQTILRAEVAKTKGLMDLIASRR
jgi:hypothetical protein